MTLLAILVSAAPIPLTSVNGKVDPDNTVLKRPLRVAIMWDYAGALKSFFESRGWYAVDYTNLTQLTHDILAGIYDAVVYAGYYGVPFPTSAEFYAFLNATMQMGVGVVWMDSWGAYGYGIKVLRQYLNDPPSVGYSYGYGEVYIRVTSSHPILKGYRVGDVVKIIAYTSADFSWFSGFSGTPIADTYVGGTIWGNAIAWKVFDNGVKWALLSSFAPTSWNQPHYFTSNAWNIIYNAVAWVASRPLNVTLENPYLHVGDLGVLYVTGGPAYTTLYVYLDGSLLATVEADEKGSATVLFTVPLVPGGEHLVEVMTKDMQYHGYTKLYVLTKVDVMPIVTPAPGRVTVVVTGLQPYQLVYVYLDGNYLTMWRANASGAFSVKVNIPLVETGDHDVLVVDPVTGDVLGGGTITTGCRLDELLSRLDQLLLAADQLELKIDTVLGDTVVIKSNLGAIEVKIGTLLEKIDLLNASITDVRDDVVYIKTKIGTLEVKVDTVFSRLDDLDAEITSVGYDVLYIRTKIGELMVKIDKVLSRLDSLSAEIAGVENDVVYIKTRIGDLAVGIDAVLSKLDALNATIIGIRDDVVYIETKIGLLEVKIDTMLSRLDDLDAKIADVKNDTVTITTRLGGLEVNVSAVLEHLGVLNAVITDIRDNVVYVKTKIGDLEAKLGDLLSALSSVNATIAGLVVDKSGELYGIIETKYGDIVAKADALSELIENKLPIDTGALNSTIVLKISELLDKAGKVESRANTAESQANTATVYAIGAIVTSVGAVIAIIYMMFASKIKLLLSRLYKLLFKIF
jgi:predicted  nucleic acid-binding Zn-ribbon protein